MDINEEKTKNMLTKMNSDISDTQKRSTNEEGFQNVSRQRKLKRKQFFTEEKIKELKENAYKMKFSEVVSIWKEVIFFFQNQTFLKLFFMQYFLANEYTLGLKTDTLLGFCISFY